MYRGVLSSGLGSHRRREVLRTSLWFVPALEVGAAIVLFAGTQAVDRGAYHGDFTLPGWVISGSADAARQILASIAADLAEAIKEQGSGNPEPHPKAGPTAAGLAARAEEGGAVLLAPVSGYVQFIRHQDLVRLATQ